MRLEFFAARLFTSQDIRGPGDSYKDLKEAYQIAIFENGRLFDDTDFFHNFVYYDHERNMPPGGQGYPPEELKGWAAAQLIALKS